MQLKNASTLVQLTANPELQQYAQGLAQSGLSPVADFLAPTVEVATTIGQYKIYNQENRFKIPDTRRAVGGRAVEISFGATDGTYRCTPHALDVPWDVLEQNEASSLGEDLLKEGAVLAAEVGSLSHEKTVIQAALTSIGAGTDKSLAAVDPVNEIDKVILAVHKAAAYGSLMKIGVLFGATAWLEFKNHTAVRSRFTTAGGNAIPNINESLASSLLLGNPDIKTTFIVEDTAAQGIAASFSFLLDRSILIFARHPNPTRRDPSFMKTFRLMGKWMVPGSYQRDDGRVEVAKMDWSEDVKVTNATAGARLNWTD